jgi:hypothetical protein
MAEFVCPECGSIDRVEGETVRFPYQCPGCDSVVNAEEAAAPEEAALTGKPIRVKLLKTVEWNRARKPGGPRKHVDPRLWVFAAAVVVILGAIAIPWSRNLESPEVGAVQASDSEAASATAAVPAQQPNDGEPTAERKASTAAAALKEREGTAGARAEEDARKAAESGELGPAISQPASVELTQSELRKAIPRGMRTAEPLAGGVPMMRQPRWAGKPIQVLKGSDLLVVVDDKRRRDWICVMSVASGAEGWVRANQVRISASD